MRKSRLLLTCGLLPALFAQQETRTATYAGTDVNGRPIAGPAYTELRSNGDARVIQTMDSVNGRPVPRESIEERVVSQSGDTKVIERVIHRYDQNGNPGPAERVRIEETRHADGTGTVNTTVYRSDLNGNTRVAEQSSTETRKHGSELTSETAVRRPTVNGSLETVERRSEVVRETAPGATEQQATVYRRDVSGQFTPTDRTVTERHESNGQVTEKTDQYTSASAGRLALTGELVSRTEKKSGGAVETVTDVYSNTVPGKAADPTRPLQLREQQTAEKRTAPDGSVVSSVVTRRPNPSDPRQLGSPQVIGESVCKGKCDQ